MKSRVCTMGVTCLAWLGSTSLARADEPPPPAAARATSESESAQRVPPPPCGEREKDGEFFFSTRCSSVFGIRGSTVSVDGVRAAQGTGLMFSGEGERFVRRGIFSAHGLHRVAIGGGGAGFEGTLLGGMTGGFRIPFGDRHGPVFRGGAFGYLRGNNAFYSSLLELPQVQVGYQYLSGAIVLELGMTTGAVLTGRHRVGEAERRVLGAGLELGAYAALQLPWVRVGASAMRLPTNDVLNAAVRVAEGTICVMAMPVAICADARAATTQAIVLPGATPSEVRSLYAGLAVGFTSDR